MMTIVRGATARLTFTLEESPAGYKNLYVILLTGDKQIEKSTAARDDVLVDGNTVTLCLSQKDTLKLRPGLLRIKIDWTYPSGDRVPTDYAVAMVYDNEPNRVLK